MTVGYCADFGSTNAAATASSKATSPSGLKQLEKDLFRPFQGLSPESSLDGVLNPANPSMPAPQLSKQARDREDQRKNWVFMKPEEILAGPYETSKRDETEKERQFKELNLSATERYLYGFLDESRKSHVKKSSAKEEDKAAAKDPFGSPFDDNQPKQKKSDARSQDNNNGDRTEQGKRSSFGAAEKRTVSKPSSFFADVFGTQRVETKEDVETEKARQDSFKQLLGMSPPKPSEDSLGGGTSFGDLFARQNAKTTAPIASPATAPKTTSPFDVQMGAITTLPKFGVIEDPNAKATAYPGMTPIAPKTEAPKSYFQTTPSFTAPRRSF